MSDSPAPDERQSLTMTQWLIVAMAAIGFAFDIYELLMLPLVARPALMELSPYAANTKEFAEWSSMWFGRMFYIPAFVGGIFGLLGGYLTDRLGRRRVLTGSILLYAFSAFASGFSTSMEMLLVFRCTTFVGVCVEFVAAVAWLAELFPSPERREKVLGYTQAFSSIGGLLVASMNQLAIKFSASLPAIEIPSFLVSLLGEIKPELQHEPWRYTLMSGLIPAIPLLVIRPFLPESPVWAEKKRAGTLKRPSIAELFQPALLRTTVITTIMFACSYGAAFGAIQQIQRIVPGLEEVKQSVAGKSVPEQKKIEQKIAANYTTVQEFGGLMGRCLLALLAVHIVSRRRLLRLFQIPGLFIVPLVFFYPAVDNKALFSLSFGESVSVTLLDIGMFLAGLCTVAQFSFWGNYLPTAYPLHLRGTGESFAANIGGRMIGTSFAWVTSVLAVQNFFPNGLTQETKLAYTSAAVALFVYAVGSIACCFLPEPDQNAMQE